jgi:hypothetical protein
MILASNLESIAENPHLTQEDSDQIEKAAEILHMLDNWSHAYPENIFKPMSSEDWADHHAALKNNSDRSGSAAAADCMRYVATQMKKSADRIAAR